MSRATLSRPGSEGESMTATRRGSRLSGFRRRLLATLSATALLLAPSLMSAPPAQASICTQLGYGANCIIDFGNPGNNGDGGDGGGGPVRPPCHTGGPDYTGVSCSHDYGLWSNDWQCYVLPMSPQPDPSDPEWGADVRAGKAVYDCRGMDGGEVTASEPRSWPGRPPTVIGNLEVGGHELIEGLLNMRFEAHYVGMAPRPSPIGTGGYGEHMGVVGAPVWLWTINTPFTPWDPPRVGSPSDAEGYWVDAKVTKVSWDMGDGTPKFTCTRDQMVEFEKWMKDRTPTCGHTYTEPGNYMVNMWTHFEVRWNDVHGEGGEEIVIRRSTVARIGESQVLAK